MTNIWRNDEGVPAARISLPYETFRFLFNITLFCAAKHRTPSALILSLVISFIRVVGDADPYENYSVTTNGTVTDDPPPEISMLQFPAAVLLLTFQLHVMVPFSSEIFGSKPFAVLGPDL